MSKKNNSEKGAFGLCNPACTKVIKFMTDHALPANIGISTGVYTSVDGFRHLNIFVEFNQSAANENPVDLGVIFAFESKGTLGARCYVNLEENIQSPQKTNFISVSGEGLTWHGTPHNKSSYVARFPVMGPFVQVFIYNKAPVERKVTVWGYAVS